MKKLHPSIESFSNPKAVRFFVSANGNGWPIIRINIIADSPSISLADIVDAFIPKVTTTNAETTLQISEDENQENLKLTRGTPEWEKAEPDALSEEDRVSVVSSPFAFLDFSYRNLYIAYTAAFRTTAELQLAFPGLELAPPIVLPIWQIETTHQAILLSQGAGDILACKNGDIWQISSPPEHPHTTCNKQFLLTEGPPSLKSAFQGLLNSNIVIPFNTLFLTSFSMTGVLYGLLLFLVIARMAWKFTAKFLSSFQNTLLRSPFGWAGLIIGVGIFIVFDLF